MRTIAQSVAAIFVALSEATGALPRAKKILAQSLRDGAITDSAARSIIKACAEIPDGSHKAKASPRRAQLRIRPPQSAPANESAD